MLLLLLGIVIGWVTLPLLVWIMLDLPVRIDHWLRPRSDPFWKPKK